MCGILGIIRRDGQAVSPAVVARMVTVMAHRGPDHEGVWTDGPAGLGHRRLAVIDLSSAAHQPMGNEDGDMILVYNGEIYNFQSLRAELEGRGHRFRSRSDTEVAVHAYEEWGDACVERFNGHFAFGLWDRRRRRLVLARDRYGVKPLYYYHDGARLLFASELKAILRHPEVRARVCYEALDEYFTFQNILSDRTLFEGIRLVPPGCRLLLEEGGEPRLERYWDYDFSRADESLGVEESAATIRRLFKSAVSRQLVSDVPLACYLSGGVDSASITCAASHELGRLWTFTCGFDLSSASGLELGCDERVHAEALSNLLKTEHYQAVLHAGDMEHIMPDLLWHLEEPRLGQCYPNYYVARLASKFVKVVLSGVGGDELFAGYPWRYYRGSAEGDFYRSYYDTWQRLTPDGEKRELFQPHVYQAVREQSTFERFRAVLEPAGLPLDTHEQRVNASLYFELKTFLPGLLLVEDKVSMAHSLETRAPFLDNDLVDFAVRVPVRHKLQNLRDLPVADEDDLTRFQRSSRGGKMILRRAMAPMIPHDFASRDKQGFSAPDASWFRGESINYINQLLRDPRARIRELIRPEYMSRRLEEHCSGQQNHRLFIWSLVSVEWWLRKFIDNSSG